MADGLFPKRKPLTKDDIKRLRESLPKKVEIDAEGTKVIKQDEEEPADEDAFENMMEAINAAELKEIVASVFETLTPKEEKIIKMRFGFEDGVERTLEEVGREFGVTRERVRQIEAKALRKLRHPTRSKRLKDFIE